MTHKIVPARTAERRSARSRVKRDPATAFLVPGTPDELLALLVEGATDYAMILTDSERRIVRWSAGAEHLLGWHESEVVGKPVDLIFTAADRDAGEPARALNEASRAGKSTGERWHLRRDASSFWGSGMTRPLHDDSGAMRGFAIVLRDATRRHLADASAIEDRRVTLALQRSLLSTLEPLAFPGLKVAALYEPASDEALIGGDFYDVFAIAEGRVALAVGDVTGKGLLAATYMAEVKFALRAYLRESPDPSRALARLNHFLIEGKRLDTRPHEEFIALSVAVLETATGAVQCAWAGMYPPLLIRTPGRPDEEALNPFGGGAPFVGIAIDTEFEIVQSVLAPGDLLLISTDGITEARDGVKKSFFGMEGVVGVIEDASSGSPSSSPEPDKLAGAIVEAARQFEGGTFKDDVCLVIVRREPLPVSHPEQTLPE